MPTVRRQPNTAYTAISRALLQDNSLSYEARGLMGYLLSKPDDWVAEFHDIERAGNIGRDKRKSLMAELEQAGYLERRKMKAAHGHWDYELVVHETPLPEERRTGLSRPATPSPSPEKPSTVAPSPDEPQTAEASVIHKREVQNRDLQNRDLESARGGEIPARVSSAVTGELNPEVQAIYEECSGAPLGIHRAGVLQAAGIADVQAWRKTCSDWRANGYSFRNLTGLIEKYRREAERPAAARQRPANLVTLPPPGFVQRRKLNALELHALVRDDIARLQAEDRAAKERA